VNRFSGEEDLQLAFRSIEICGESNLLVGVQFFASSCNCSRIPAIFGRADDSEDSNSSTHIWSNNTHSGSVNPTVGLSGRCPLRTFWITAASGLVCSKGRRPETTYGEKVRLHDESSRNGGSICTSRTVIPKAYMSVLFDGNFLRARLT